jgi:polyphosphate kinase
MAPDPTTVRDRRVLPEGNRSWQAHARTSQDVPPDVDPRDLKHPSLYINRELSWLEFNQRVLDQACDPSHPLLERVKFLAIVGTNLDEFFMIRVSTTQKKLRAGLDDVGSDGYNTEQQLELMWNRALRMLEDQAACWESLRALLAAEGIRFFEPEDWASDVRAYLAEYFAREVYPVVTPLAFDPGHPFPLISNLSKNVAVVVSHGGRTKFARVKVPDVLPRFIPIPDRLTSKGGLGFVFLEDVLLANIQQLFPGTEVKAAHLFRVVRDTDPEIEQDEADDLLETVDRSLRERRRGALSLLQVDAGMPVRVLNILAENFEIGDDLIVRTDQRPGFNGVDPAVPARVLNILAESVEHVEAGNDVIVRTGHRMGFGDWMQLTRIHRPELKDPVYSPRSLWRADEDPEVIFDQIGDRDQLVHHPFESFGSVEAFLRAAVKDPHVVAVKMTLYRIGPNSPLIDLLIEAAGAGKIVAVLVELKARFDERNNILWAKRLESHGIHVVYGFAAIKTHAKLCLVVRQEPEGMKRYVHVATGNYNPGTAKVYTDLGLFTADPEIVADASDVFNYLTGYSNQKQFRRLLVAPVQLRARLTELIEREAEHARAGRPTGIVIKMNALTDDQMIRVLYRGSQAGVPIDLLVRGTCGLRPGIPGISESIRVRSIVGRFLEHSRLYWFRNGGSEEMYIGSADLMERNLDRRVETLIPVGDRGVLRHLRDVVLDAYLRDTARAYRLGVSGLYEPPERPGDGFDAQRFLLAHYAQAQGD